MKLMKKKMAFIVIMSLALSTLTGCAAFDSITNDLNGEITGIHIMQLFIPMAEKSLWKCLDLKLILVQIS